MNPIESLYLQYRKPVFSYLYGANASDPDRLVPNLTRFVNEKGEVGIMEDYGQSGGGPGKRMSLFIGKEFVEKSDTITVEIGNLAETQAGHWSTGEKAGQ